MKSHGSIDKILRTSIDTFIIFHCFQILREQKIHEVLMVMDSFTLTLPAATVPLDTMPMVVVEFLKSSVQNFLLRAKISPRNSRQKYVFCCNFENIMIVGVQGVELFFCALWQPF